MFSKRKMKGLALLIVTLPILAYLYLHNSVTDIYTAGNVHFYYVIASSAIAFLVGFAAFTEYRKNKVVKLFYIAVGFIGVGVFYTYHALVTPTMTIPQLFGFPDIVTQISVFVFFGDMSRLWLAILMFVPDDMFEKNEKAKKYFNGYFIGILMVVLFGAVYLGLLRPEIFPVFKNTNMTDTYIAIFTKVATLLFLGINALKYYYSYKAKPNLTTLSFIVGLLLIMETTIVFMISVPWSSTWWLAHNLFLSSYLVIGAGVLYSYFGKEKYEYFDVVGQIYKYTRLLEEKNESLYTLANHDSLTGLPNREYFITKMEAYIHEAEKNNGKFALLYMDLDHFKAVNDQYGHKVGDELLKIVANKVNNSIKSDDTFSRIGGDEFVLLLKESEKAHLGTIAERILKKVWEPLTIDSNRCEVGASIGISIYPDSGTTLDALISSSDKAMYAVKESTRNAFIISEDMEKPVDTDEEAPVPST